MDRFRGGGTLNLTGGVVGSTQARTDRKAGTMPNALVEFRYLTGLPRRIFRNPRLRGSWNTAGRYSSEWSETPMEEFIGEDGCPAFRASLGFDPAEQGRVFHWGVLLDAPGLPNEWGIPSEVENAYSSDRTCSFTLSTGPQPQVECYYLTYCRRLGANKRFAPGCDAAGLVFSVWAPNARSVEVVFGKPERGYIDDNGDGIDASQPPVPLALGADGIWESTFLPGFAGRLGRPYMYRIVNAQGETTYRTDIFARGQAGRGARDPAAGDWPGTPETLDGGVSCSVVIDPDVVRREFGSSDDPSARIPCQEFWLRETGVERPVPSRVDDLVIYELHVGGLGTTPGVPGTLADALAFLDHLVDLGVNAVELLPLAEFSGAISWGYGDTHYMVIESSAGGRDKYRHFVRECHRRGIAVIQDVVYNHYDFKAGRSEWQYDSTAPEENIYYWYEGSPSDYPAPDGGYVDNGSSGWAPRYWEPVVRRQFISGAAFLIEEMHVDGLRVDLTEAMHRDNRLHADGRSLAGANLFGQKLLREWSRTLRLIRPDVMLIAEDHSNWPPVTQPPAAGGLGFDATWYVDFYHNLIGDSDSSVGSARLLKQAGYGGDEPLALDWFAGALEYSTQCKVVYHESHDEAGNAAGSARTIWTAVNGAPLWGATRDFAEARCRVVFGLSLLSAGTPMFFMGEEVGAWLPYPHDHFLENRVDIPAERRGNGRRLFRYYQDTIALGNRLRAIRGSNLHIVHASNDNRVLVFKRWRGSEELLVVASLNNQPFEFGYAIESDPISLPDAHWKEIFNSDAALYGGASIGNAGAIVPSSGGRITVRIPANGLIVLVRQG